MHGNCNWIVLMSDACGHFLCLSWTCLSNRISRWWWRQLYNDDRGTVLYPVCCGITRSRTRNFFTYHVSLSRVSLEYCISSAVVSSSFLLSLYLSSLSMYYRVASCSALSWASSHSKCRNKREWRGANQDGVNYTTHIHHGLLCKRFSHDTEAADLGTTKGSSRHNFQSTFVTCYFWRMGHLSVSVSNPSSSVSQ